MIQLVADHRVLVGQQRLEQPAVGVEAGRVQDRVVGAEEAGDAVLELLVHLLGAADEADAGQPVAPPVNGLLGRLGDARVARQPQVVVRAEVQDLGPVAHPDAGSLRGDDDALGLEKTVRADRVELRPDLKLGA